MLVRLPFWKSLESPRLSSRLDSSSLCSQGSLSRVTSGVPTVMNVICEEEFLGFCCWLRTVRRRHDALGVRGWDPGEKAG